MEGGAREQPTSNPWGRKSKVEPAEGGALVCVYVKQRGLTIEVEP